MDTERKSPAALVNGEARFKSHAKNSVRSSAPQYPEALGQLLRDPEAFDQFLKQERAAILDMLDGGPVERAAAQQRAAKIVEMFEGLLIRRDR